VDYFSIEKAEKVEKKLKKAEIIKNYQRLPLLLHQNIVPLPFLSLANSF